MTEREIDEDLRWVAIEERRAWRRATRCVCGDDLPGQCPGPLRCPYSGVESEDDE